ncbi:MAG: VOC family protein [Bacteroidota bacterium]|nr:VOC family protein [Bacteroidota bacterium]MDP4234056.1 VOC family protein [Bacteroidota bacterium]MDP4242922.1 VOC family protein [Bacteroidota bacterium]MDP4289271.1 VOC family protein [Bacteroidota bacterium]
MADTHPTFGNGKICYLEIPASDIQLSAQFYRAAFGWEIRSDNADNAAFDDSVGEVSGMWVLGKKPSTEQGILISIMVDSIPDTLALITANGGRVVNAGNATAQEQVALFADPFGNVLQLYQHNH